MALPVNKSTLRTLMRAIVDEIPAENIASASKSISDSLLQHLRKHDARAIMLWMPLPGEVDLLTLGDSFLRDGRRVCMPRMNWDQHTMEPVPVTSMNDGYEIRRHNIREPIDTLSMPVEALDVILVPGLAFDPNGCRLGRGGGYYDRFLPRLHPHTATIGVCFSVQRVDSIPIESHDVPLSIVVCQEQTTQH